MDCTRRRMGEEEERIVCAKDGRFCGVGEQTLWRQVNKLKSKNFVMVLVFHIRIVLPRSHNSKI